MNKASPAIHTEIYFALHRLQSMRTLHSTTQAWSFPESPGSCLLPPCDLPAVDRAVPCCDPRSSEVLHIAARFLLRRILAILRCLRWTIGVSNCRLSLTRGSWRVLSFPDSLGRTPLIPAAHQAQPCRSSVPESFEITFHVTAKVASSLLAGPLPALRPCGLCVVGAGHLLCLTGAAWVYQAQKSFFCRPKRADKRGMPVEL